MSSKSVSKGSRVSSLLDQIGKHWQIPIRDHFEDHDLDSIRNLTGKLVQLVSSQEKCRKELISNHERGITLLLSILRGLTSDMQISYNILYILNELLTSGKRVTIILDHDAIRHIFHVLEVAVVRSPGRELQVYEEVIAVLHTLLSKLGNKDKRFSVQARLCGAVSHTLVAIKQFQHSFKVLLPALQVLKIYANSSVNCVKMVKEGAVGLIVKVLSHCGLKRTVTLKLTLELLANLVKSKNGAKKAVQAGAVPVLLNMFLDWQRLDHRNRQINLRKAILSCLRGIVNSTSGRKALTDLDGLKTFYAIGCDGLEQKEMDGIVKLLILILRRMVTKKLPVRYPKMLITFSVGGKRSGIKMRKLESKSSSAKGESFESNSQGTTDLEDSDADSDDECVLETQEDDDDDEGQEKATSPLRESPLGSSSSTSVAERTDLECYRAFLPELDQFENESNSDKQEEAVEECRDKFPPIVIPTVSMEPEPNNVYSYAHESTASFQNGEKDVNTATPGSAEVATMESMIGSIRLQNGNYELEGCSEIRESTTHGATTVGLGETGHEGRESEERINLPAYASSEVILKEVESGLFHLLPFVKRASPELYGHYPPADLEPLLERKPVLPRVMVFQDFARFLHPDKVINRVVYDLDELIRCESDSAPAKTGSPVSPASSATLLTKDSHNLPSSSTSGTKQDVSTSLPLRFESRFECGNLRRAIQVRQHEYDLILSPDINTDHHHQWFYFEVQDMESGIPYKFNIINCEKFNSQFNFGMQPVLYSTKEAIDGRPGWERAGYNVCYYKNFFVRNGINQTSMRYFYTTTFTIKFPHANDVCYLAYHFPYSCSMLKVHLNNLETRLPPSVFYSRQVLCKTILGNPCEVLTITSRPNASNDEAMQNFRKRPYILLTCRVHPGESSSSWIMKGVLDFLLSTTPLAELLRSTYVFKIVPMLNPDGVINGCHRCSVAGEDLNRKWLNPDANLHPTIYHTKGLIQYLNTINKTPLVYCDFHGHSRRKNVFMYGCSMAVTANARSQGNTEALKIFLPRYGELKAIRNGEGEDPAVTVISEDPGYKALPKILNSVSPAFAIQNCNFVMEKSKEGTARIVVYKELGVLRSYTLESTYCGADQGPYKGYHFSTRELEEMGRDLCVGLQRLPPCRSQVAEEFFAEGPFEGPPDPELSRLDEDQDFAMEDLPLPSRLGLVREPILQEMLGSAEDE